MLQKADKKTSKNMNQNKENCLWQPVSYSSKGRHSECFEHDVTFGSDFSKGIGYLQLFSMVGFKFFVSRFYNKSNIFSRFRFN